MTAQQRFNILRWSERILIFFLNIMFDPIPIILPYRNIILINLMLNTLA
jgi:hypothetical protein